MTERKLTTAVLGLSDAGQQMLKAISRVAYFHLHAVADKDPNVAQRLAEEYKCDAYDDYRQLIMQNQLDCLLVAAGMHSCDEYVRTAMKNKFNVLKIAPPARNFDEAAQFVRLAQDEAVQFAVVNPGRFSKSYLAMRSFIAEGRLDQPFMITAFCNAAGEQVPPWYTDPKLAGGGVLLRSCYEMVDQIVLNFPLPTSVYCLSTNQAQDKQQRLYLTEDTAVVAMKFSDTLVGNLVASRRTGVGPREQMLKICAKDTTLSVDRGRFTVRDGLGQAVEHLECQGDELSGLMELLENFALSILSPDEHKLVSSARENLKNMALIEAAYLSARTGMPEEPPRILQMAQLQP